MSEIYKVNRVINNEISQIYVFTGDGSKTVEEIKRDRNIFSAKEIRDINEKNIPVHVIDEYIHGDDTIKRIKEKIFIECKYIENSTPDMMYLFSITETKLNIDKTYADLTQEDTIDLTDNRLKQFLSNIVSNKDTIVNKRWSSFFGNEEKSDKYEYDNFNKLNIEWDNKVIYTQSIGQKLVIRKKYPFIANPFNNNILDDFLKRTTDNIITTQNAYLLFKYFPLKNNNIYLCLVDDVLRYAEQNSLDESYFFKLYYPILHKNIENKKQLLDEKIILYQTERTRINKYYKRLNEKVDVFYDIQRINPKSLNYHNMGISYIYITLHPLSSIKLPLEILFKLIHSTKEIPLIKYNPGKDYENIYRLFTDDNISLSGIKIPSLFVNNNNRKTKIMNISKILSRKESIGFFIEHNYKKRVLDIYCEFNENGTVEIKFESQDNLLEQREIEQIIDNAINKTVLNTIRNYLKQSGYNYIDFKSLNGKNIEINSMNFETVLKNDIVIDIKKYMGCISTIFNVIGDSLEKSSDIIELMYKRVNVFQVMDSIKAFITTLRQNGLEGLDIITALIDNYPRAVPNEEKAIELLAEWQQEVQLRIDTFGEGKKVIESNPGFPTEIYIKTQLEGTFTVVKMNNINDIRYLQFIIPYIDSLFKIVLKKTNDELKSKINRICNKKIKEQEIVDVVKDIQADSEKTGAVKFGEKPNNMLEIEEDTDEEELLDIEEDTDDDGEEEEEEDEVELGDDMFGDDEIVIGDDEIELGDDNSKTKKTPSKEDSIESVSSDLSLLDEDGLSEIEDSIDDMEDSSLGGGAKEDGKVKKDLAGLSISGAKSIFTKRLRDNDSVLFQKKDTPGYSSYTKGCPNQYKRQPISITDEEKEYIDLRDAENGTSSYGEFIRYGSPSSKDGKKYNYICPRFWCLNDEQGKQRSLTLEQINNGECGGWNALIPEKAKKVPRNGRIVEFTDDRFHRGKAGISSLSGDKKDLVKKLLYRPMYPGFQNPEKHKDGLCIPCCFQTPFKQQETIPQVFNDKKIKREAENKEKDNFSLFGWKEEEQLPFMFKKVGSEFPYHKDLIIKDEEGINKIDLEKLKSAKFSNFRDKFLQVKEPRSNNSCLEHRDNMEDQSKLKSGPVERAFNRTPIFSFPLRKNQFGYMQYSLPQFLGFDNSICFSNRSGSDKKLKNQTYCILRLGITKNKKQSFLELIASVYNYYEKMKRLPSQLNDMTLEELKILFIKNLTIDKFVMAQNGILPTLFENTNIEIDMSNYSNSKYFSGIRDDNYKMKIARAFENFKNYINDENEYIDYKYIWDLITKPINKGGILFNKGFNLLIFKDPDDDSLPLRKIEIICPTNHYANEFFDIKKRTLMIFQKGDYFEPLCKVHKRGTVGKEEKATRDTSDFEVKKFFKKTDFDQFSDKSNLPTIISNIKSIMLKTCLAKKSSKKYDYKRNISSHKLITILESMNYIVSNQVINYNNKVIGVIASINQETQYLIPSRPSPILIDKSFIFTDDIPINEYMSTKTFLQKLYEDSQNKIPCNIIQKIISGGMVVGLKTLTNQVVPVIPTQKSDVVDDIEELDTYSGNNVYETDKYVSNTKIIDEQRELVIKSLELENNFYNLFRNTLKIILTDRKNTAKKNNILTVVQDPSITYIEKFEKILTILHELLDNVINFIEFRLDTIEDYDNMITCLGLDKQNCDDTSYCSFMRKNTCMLTIPENNLYSNVDNRKSYFNKLVDQIIRYSKIRKYLFTPREILSFDYVNYKINNNEIVLLEEILTDTYFDNVQKLENNKYIKSSNIYDIINPTKGINYSTTVKESIIDEGKKSNDDILDCLIPNSLSLKFLKTISNNNTNFKVDQYDYNAICGFELVKKMIYIHTNKEVSIEKIKKKLIEEYLKLNMPSTELELNKTLVSSWRVFSYVNWLNRNKKVSKEVLKKPDEMKNDEIKLQIEKETYIPTEIDLFLLLKYYEIPTIIKMKSKETTLLNVNVDTLITFDNSPEEVYVIIASKKKKEKESLTKANRTFFLLKIKDTYKIPVEILNRQLLDGERSMNELISNSLIFQKAKKDKKTEQDRLAQERRREKTQKKKIKKKKIKLRLPSE